MRLKCEGLPLSKIPFFLWLPAYRQPQIQGAWCITRAVHRITKSRRLGIIVCCSGANYRTFGVSLFMEGFFAIGGAIPREAARSEERERDLRGLQQLMALKNPSPSTVPVPMAVPKALGYRLFSCRMKLNRVSRIIVN